MIIDGALNKERDKCRSTAEESNQSLGCISLEKEEKEETFPKILESGAWAERVICQALSP